MQQSIHRHVPKIIIEYKEYNLNINNIEYMNEYEKNIINESEYFNYFV